MNIMKVTTNKKEYIELLLLADEQEDMIDKYLDQGDMFVLEDTDGMEQALKPMSCPNAIMVYKNKIRSYKDLPLRYNDVDAIHRNEGAASLHGLLRVRVFHQDDSHNFIRQDQIADEISSIIDIANYFYDIFGLKFTPYLSRDGSQFGEIEKKNYNQNWIELKLDKPPISDFGLAKPEIGEPDVYPVIYTYFFVNLLNKSN